MADLITEWAPLLRRDGGNYYALGFYALLALALGGVRGARPEAVVLALGTTAQAFAAVRFVPLAALAVAPIALRGASRALDRLRPVARVPAATLLSAALAAVCVAPSRHGFGAGVAAAVMPVGAARFMASHPPRGPLFNEFTFGGYLIWALEGTQPVYIDGRSMALYDPDFVDETLRARAEALGPIFDRRGIAVMVHRTSSMLTWAEARPGWSVVYFDDLSFVAVRDAGNEALVAAHGYRALRPGDWSGDVVRLRGDPSGLAAARAEASRARSAAPDAAHPLVLEGAVALAAGDIAGATRAFTEATRRRPEAVPPWRGLLMCCPPGDGPCICARGRAVLARAPANRHAREAMRAVGCAEPTGP
jgi:hypothetical protein